MRAYDIIGILGPTAVGKSVVSDLVAVALDAEIVSADSMQVYRGMDVGTAKTPPAERPVPYHCVDLVDPGTPYSAALYQRDARAAIDALLARNTPAVVVGGTGLYVRAALDDMEFPAGDTLSPARERLEARLAEEGGDALYAELDRLDPASAALLHPNNARRVVRALEMLAEGTSYATQAAGFRERDFHYPRTLLVGLTVDRDELYRRVDARVDAMIESGLVEEVRELLETGLSSALTATQAIGYKELVPALAGESGLSEAIDTIKRSTRRYAKRQLTWFRGDSRIKWIDVTGLSATQAAGRVLDLVESSEHDA